MYGRKGGWGVRIAKNEQNLSHQLFWLVELVFSRSTGENPFSVRLGDHLFQPAKSMSRDYGVKSILTQKKNGWKTVLLRNFNRIKQNRLQLKRLIPIEHVRVA